MMQRILLLFAHLSSLPLLAFWVAIGVRVLRDPGNHVGWSPLWALPFFACLAGWCLFTWIWTKRRSIAALGLFAAASLLGVYLLDRLAILMSYESWIARGMPARPF
ncbi:MAG TPA: hypothetical protein VFQ61_17320 [Polyangiaceae bacterium]|nr:hypothetical protein [Polyangiaceae bacterium]